MHGKIRGVGLTGPCERTTSDTVIDVTVLWVAAITVNVVRDTSVLLTL
ncbi:MAG: hypothetical protein H7Z43_06435 [Clostridia bacterium]|nr:hypothetical protein [Deltaproteobacteria bacterium]